MKNKSLNSIEKAISYPARKQLKKGGKPEEEKPKPKPQSNVIPFPIKPGMPLYEWWKTNKDKTMYVASVEELGPFLTKFYSEKQFFDKAIIFLDPSDIIDELFIRYDKKQ